MPAMAELLLKRATPQWKPNCGRILLSDASPASQWVWTVSYGYHEGRTPTHGYAESREAAMRHSRRVATENEADASQAYPQRPSNNMDHHRGAEFDIRLLLPACLRTLV